MKKISLVYVSIVLFIGLSSGTISGIVQENTQEDEDIHLVGTIEGTGSHFEITDSEYLNVILDSTEAISLILESAPKMVTMYIESVSSATFTYITLRGFPPNTTFYKYEDDYHNLEVILTDESGSCLFVQDLSTPHSVFIQPSPSTIFIPTDTSAGTWDDVNRIYTLTENVHQAIQIDEANLTLDGNGYTIASPANRTGTGIFIPQKPGVTIKNVNVSGFYYGIRNYVSDNVTILDNRVSNTSWGIRFEFCNNGTLSGNNASDNYIGIYVKWSNNIEITQNEASNNTWWSYGIYLLNTDYSVVRENTCLYNVTQGIILTQGSDHNTVMNNISSNNRFRGIFFHTSNNNILSGNTFNNNGSGIEIRASNNNDITDNSISHNSLGILFHSFRGDSSNDNKIYNNDFIENNTQASVSDGSGNIFNLDKPIGGNYWSNWICPDGDDDGFVDNPYIFSGGQDDLPLVPEGGCVNMPPVANAGPDQSAILSETVQFDGRASFDPDGYIVSYEWNFGDGTPSGFGPVVSHTYYEACIYTASLTVTDHYGATSVSSTTVEILAPEQALERLINLVGSMNLEHGIANSFISKLEAAQAALVAPNSGVREDAVNKLKAFINAVEAQRGKKLTALQADQLLDYTYKIIAAIGG